MKPRTWIVVVCCLLLAASAAAQQAFYGSIVGNVADQSGAVIPDANVVLINTETGVSMNLTSSATGLFQALNLKTGTYKITVTKQGFKTFVRDKIAIDAGQQVRINAELQVGDVGQTVEVVAASPLINLETQTTNITGVFENKNTVTLPSGGTGFQVFPDIYYQLAYSHADVQNFAFTIGGSVASSNAEVQDGMRVEGQRHYVGGNRGLARPGIDSVEEVVVTTTNPSAKYPNAAAIETVMKSGSNNWHGTLMYIHGNKALNSRSYFGHTKSPFLLHQYFGSIGGPIKKNKTFFFFGQQGFYHPNGEESFSSFPTAKMRGGDLSELIDPAFMRGTTYTVNDPLTGQPFANNRIPDARISPIAKKILEMYPPTNRASDTSAGPLYQRNYLLTDLLIRKEKFNFDTRVDHYFTPTQHTYVRFSRFDSPNARTQYNFPNFGGNYFIIKTKTMTAHHTSTFTPSLINHVMLGIFNENDPLGAGDFRDVGKEPAWNKQLGIAGIPDDQDSGFPSITMLQTGLTTPFSWGFGNYKNRYTHLRDDLSHLRGRHNIQAGFDFRHESEGSAMPGVGQGNAGTCQYGCMRFNGRWTGLDYADFLLGLPFDSARFTLLPPDVRFRNEWGFYFQDDIKWSQKLTINVGLRYDYFSIVTSEHDFASFFDVKGKQLVVPSQAAISAIKPSIFIPVPVVTAQAAGLENTLLAPDKRNWGPRIGVAYRVRDNTVVRGGLGVYTTPLSFSMRRLLTGPFAAREDFPPVQPGPNDPPVLTMANPYTGAGKGTSLVSFFGGDPNVKNPLHYSYNLAIERQFGPNALTVEYVGKNSIMAWQRQLNTVPPSTTPYSLSRLPFPTLGSILGLEGGAHYIYQALRIHGKRRLSRGLFFDISYNWAKTIDSLGGGCTGGDNCGAPENPFNRDRDRGETHYMPPHRLTVNYVYDIPFGKKDGLLSFPDSPGGRVLNYIIQGWQTAGTYNFVTSAPLTPSGRYLNAEGKQYDAPNVNRTSGRPDYTGATLEPTDQQRAQGYVFNPNAFSEYVPAGRYGTAGRGILRLAAGRIGMNQSFFRNFRIPKFFVGGDQGANLRIGLLFFNAINHSDGGSPTTALNSALYGKISNQKIGGDYTGFMRTITFQARLEF